MNRRPLKSECEIGGNISPRFSPRHLHASMWPWLFVAPIAVITHAQAQSNVPDYSRQTGVYEMQVSLSDSKPHIEWMFLPREIRRDVLGQLTMRGVSQAVVAYDRVYFMTEGPICSVYALNAQNGNIHWRYDHVTASYNGGPSVDSERVYFGSKTGVTALAREDGSLLWHFPLEFGHGEGVPLPIADRIYFSGYDGFGYALDCHTGALIWKHNFADDANRDPKGFDGERARFAGIPVRPRGSASDGRIFIQSVFDQSRLVAMDCQTGKRLWDFQATGWIGPAATIVGDQVFICSQDKFLYCLDRVTGKELWSFATPTWNSSRVAVHDGTIYLPVHRGRMFQLDSITGVVQQAFDPPQEETGFGAVYTFPIVHDNNVIYVEGDGQVLNLDAINNQLHWQFRPRPHSELFTDPVSDGKRIFVTSRQKDNQGECALVALGFGKQPSTQILRGDAPGIETLFDDLATIEAAQQSGPAGYLYYLSATGQFCIVFPKTAADWNVFEQLSAAREQATQFYSEQTRWLVDEAQLDGLQQLKLNIAINRTHQESLRELRDLVDDLKNTTAQAFHGEGGTMRRFDVRCNLLTKSIAKFEPLAKGSAVYRVLPSILSNDQSRAFKRRLLKSSLDIYRSLRLTPQQENQISTAFEALTRNPLDLRPGQLAIVLRENQDFWNAMTAVLDEAQLKVWKSWK